MSYQITHASQLRTRNPPVLLRTGTSEGVTTLGYVVSELPRAAPSTEVGDRWEMGHGISAVRLCSAGDRLLPARDCRGWTGGIDQRRDQVELVSYGIFVRNEIVERSQVLWIPRRLSEGIMNPRRSAVLHLSQATGKRA